MKPCFEDSHRTLYNGDCRDMADIPDETVQCVVTSPPYWGLRKYTGEQELVWGDSECEHRWDLPNTREKNYVQSNPDFARPHREHKNFVATTNTCSLCGAWKGGYGLEPTPEMYVQHTVEILREVRRVLRSDGCVFWNIGDSYYSSASNQQGRGVNGSGAGSREAFENIGRHLLPRHSVLKPKDLCLIPFRVAIALQEDDWYVRSDIIWAKPNPMPESVTDRPTRSHEYILLLTKSGKSQYWTHRDGAGTRRRPKADYRWVNQITKDEVDIAPSDWKVKIKCPDCDATGKVNVYLGLDVWQEKECDTCNCKKETQLWKRINLWKGHDYYWDADAVREPHTESTLARIEYGLKHRHPDNIGIGIPPVDTDRMGERFAPQGGRNIRSVWTFPTQPYPQAHFATFPEKLPELCIKAATPEVGCCSNCGAPWERVVEKKQPPQELYTKTENPDDGLVHGHRRGGVFYGAGQKVYDWISENPPQTLGWQQTCSCLDAEKVGSIVLDPFAGAGTTLKVAAKLNRRAIGYELSKEYCDLIVNRNRQGVL